MERTTTAVTPERYASGLTFEQYLQYVASPENLGREGGANGERRRDWSGWMRSWYESVRLSDAQTDGHPLAVRARPGGPAQILVLAEEWSSDCRRDIPMLKRLAEVGGLELRIFRRDGQRFGRSQRPSLAEVPDSNADLMAEFLNVKRGQTWQSIPGRRLLHRGSPLPVSLHRVSQDLRQGPAGLRAHPLRHGPARRPRRPRRAWIGSSERLRRRRSSASGPRPRSTRSSRRSTSGSSSARTPERSRGGPECGTRATPGAGAPC